MVLTCPLIHFLPPSPSLSFMNYGSAFPELKMLTWWKTSEAVIYIARFTYGTPYSKEASATLALLLELFEFPPEIGPAQHFTAPSLSARWVIALRAVHARQMTLSFQLDVRHFNELKLQS